MGISGAEQHILHAHFGAFLKMRRDQWGVRQREVLLYLPGWTQASYSRLESGAIAPAFDQLLPIYTALQQAGVSWSAADRQRYLALARTRIQEKKRQSEQHDEREWADLRYQLANVDFLLDEPDEAPDRWSPPKSLQAETRHLLGRQDWLADLTQAIQTASPKKLVVLHGPVGIGKSSELHRLMQHFIGASDPAYHVIWIPLLPAERSAGPESSLTLMLGNMLAESGAPPPTPEMASWEKQQRLLFAYLEQSPRPVVILVDNAESALLADGTLAPCWEEFLAHWLRRQHRATLVMATKEWPGWPGRERGLVYESKVPPLDLPTSIVLLQQQGLEAVPVADLQEVWQRVGGIPLYLEWVASLAQNPHQLNEWQSFDLVEGSDDVLATGEQTAQAISQRLTRLLTESALLRGHLAGKLRPLLARIIEKRLSTGARALLDVLSVCNVPLGKTALQSLCEHPGLINELRNASLLVPYVHRVQVLPVVADVVTRELAEERVRELERQAIRALKRWKKEGSLNDNEAGNVMAELVTLLIKHHRLLDAAQQLLSYHSFISNSGHAPRLARFARTVMNEFDWHVNSKTECGGLLLYHTLAPFLGLTIDDRERITAFRQILNAVSAEKMKLWVSVEAYLMSNILESAIGGSGLEEAYATLETTFARLKSLQPEKIDLQEYLLEEQARILGVWSDYFEEQGEKQMAHTLREQSIDLYRKCHLSSSTDDVLSSLNAYLLKTRLSSHANDLAYYLAREGRFEEALQVIEQSIVLKEQGYLQFGTLAAAYGEKSEILVELGRLQEALLFDEKALVEARRLANTGHTTSQQEVWMYLANRGRLFLQLGKIDEAERLLREALPRIQPRRGIYRMFAKTALDEIEQWRKTKNSRYQLDWRWVERYRELSAYDMFWWWAQAGPFTEEEQRQWDQLYIPDLDEATKHQLGELIAQSRQRELQTAIAEQREPYLHYPALSIEDVQQRIAGLLQLGAEIQRDEPHVIVRKLYRDAIDEEIRGLRLVEATYEGNTIRFRELMRSLIPEPTSEEMEYVLSRVGQMLKCGLAQPQTMEVSQRLIRLLQEQFHLTLDLSRYEAEVRDQGDAVPPSRLTKQKIAPETARRFFETVLRDYGYENWQVHIDPNAQDARIEQGLRRIFLTDAPLSPGTIRYYVSHELAGHVARCMAGEHSILGLLGIHTKNSLETEEGLAVYYDLRTGTHSMQAFDDITTWQGTFAVGLASGTIASPQTFHSLYTFLETFYLLFQLLRRPDANVQKAEKRAKKYALSLCLRTFLGVPNLKEAGVCLTKDVLYLRGLKRIEQAVAQDESVLNRLVVGVVALEQLPDLQELGIVEFSHPLRNLANDPDLDTYILSFEQNSDEEWPANQSRINE